MSRAADKVLLNDHLKYLKLPAMLHQYEECARQALEAKETYESFLLALVTREVEQRQSNQRKRRIHEARFPLMKTLETFHFEKAVGLDARQIQQLCTCEYINQCHNVIFLGQSGTGKTHLATGLGIEACKQGFRTRFVTGCGLVNELLEAQEERVLSRLLKRYASYDLLILDELGYVPFSKAGAELLFQVLAERHERKAVIVTTNLGFADWTQIFGSEQLTAALLDRLTHRAVILEFVGESYRFRERMQREAQEGKNLVQQSDDKSSLSS